MRLGQGFDWQSRRTPGLEATNDVSDLRQPEARDDRGGQGRLVALVADQGHARTYAAELWIAVGARGIQSPLEHVGSAARPSGCPGASTLDPSPPWSPGELGAAGFCVRQ